MENQGGGALKQSFIDQESSTSTCSEFLRLAIHTPFTELDAPTATNENGIDNDSESDIDLADVGMTCHQQFGGLCQQDQSLDVICKPVKVFNRALLEHDVKVGSLLFMSTDSFSYFGFLGVCMARPLLHVLIEPDQDEGNFLFSGEVHFETSHQLFQRMIAEGGSSVQVEIWRYSLLMKGTNNGLFVKALGKVKDFTLDKNTKLTVRKPRPKLRVRLSAPASKTKKLQGLRQKKKKHKRKAAGNQQGFHQTWEEEASLAACSEASDGSTTEVDPLKDVDLHEETEQYQQSAEANREEAKVNRMMESQMVLLDAAADAAGSSEVASSSSHVVPRGGSDAVKSEPATTTADSSKPSTPSLPPSSYFAKGIGLDSCAEAVSARSSCFYCNNKIAKGEVRFSWYHNTRRPSVWVHQGCLRHLYQREGLANQVSQRLSELANIYPHNDSPIGFAVAAEIAALKKHV